MLLRMIPTFTTFNMQVYTTKLAKISMLTMPFWPWPPLPNLQSLLSHYFSFWTNSYKTTALNITLSSTVSQLKTFPYSWNSSFLFLFCCNCYLLLRSLTSLMQLFPSLSWIGRIHAVKMTVLPKLLYYFRTLPLHVPSFFLHHLQSRILSFIWAYQRPRVSRPTLYRHDRLQGGLGVPNIAKCYQAAQISQLILLHATPDIPLWVLLELPNCTSIPLSTLL